jgi:predicted Zn-dependent protease with MMP-like domain
LDKRTFEKYVARALEDLPEELRSRIENVEVLVEEEPDPGLLDEMGVPSGATLLGLYQGVPLPARGQEYGNVLPDRVLIFMGPILRNSVPTGGIEELVRDVVFHEIGHYFGFSENALRKLQGGREKGRKG